MARAELYEQFGPRLIEALALVVLDEVNALRTEAGLAERTSAQLVTAIKTKLAGVPEKIYGQISE